MNTNHINMQSWTMTLIAWGELIKYLCNLISMNPLLALSIYIFNSNVGNIKTTNKFRFMVKNITNVKAKLFVCSSHCFLYIPKSTIVYVYMHI
jgi:hypothetical protein